MPHGLSDNDDWNDADESWDDEGNFDDSDDDDDGAVPCPHCHRSMHEDAPRCPHCGRYTSDEDAPPVRKPWWIVVGTVVCLYIIYRWIVG